MITESEKLLIEKFGFTPNSKGIPRGAIKKPYCVRMIKKKSVIYWRVFKYDFNYNLSEDRPKGTTTKYVPVGKATPSKSEADRFCLMLMNEYKAGKVSPV